MCVCVCLCVCAVFPRHVVGVERRTEHGGPCGHQAGQREVDTTVGNLKSTGEIEKGHLGVSGTEMVMLAVIVRTVIFVHTYRLLFHLLLSYLLLFQTCQPFLFRRNFFRLTALHSAIPLTQNHSAEENQSKK